MYLNKKLVYPFIGRLDSGVSKPRGKPLFVAATVTKDELILIATEYITYDKQIGKILEAVS